jgi:hypothetical protein
MQTHTCTTLSSPATQISFLFGEQSWQKSLYIVGYKVAKDHAQSLKLSNKAPISSYPTGSDTKQQTGMSHLTIGHRHFLLGYATILIACACCKNTRPEGLRRTSAIYFADDMEDRWQRFAAATTMGISNHVSQWTTKFFTPSFMIFLLSSALLCSSTLHQMRLQSASSTSAYAYDVPHFYAGVDGLASPPSDAHECSSHLGTYT